MTQQRGANAKIVIGFEDTFGTEATDGFVLPINSISLRPAQNINTAATLRGGRNPIQPFRGNKDVNGSIVVPVDTRAMWYWLKAMFGDPVTAGGAAAAWQATHAYDLGDFVIPTVANGRYYEATADTGSSAGTEPTWPTTVGATVVDGGITWTCRAFIHEFKIPEIQPSLTIEEQFEDLDTEAYIRYYGCKISSFAIEVGGDGELTATLNVVGADFEVDTSPFDATPTEISIARVNNFQAALAEGGSTLSNGTAQSFSIDMGLDTDTFVIGGGGVRGDIVEGVVGVGGSLTTLFEDVSLVQKAIDGTESSLKLTITGSAVSVFELEAQEIEYAVNGPEVPGPQGIRVTLDYQAFYDDGTEASAIVARLTNIDQHAA